jgi:hypothetical protein
MPAFVLDNQQLRMWVDKGRKIRMTWRELNDQLRKATKVKPILQLYKAERSKHGEIAGLIVDRDVGR